LTKKAFRTVAEAQEQARRRLPRSLYESLVGGWESGHTVADNIRAFDEVEFATSVSAPAATPALTTTIMGQEIPTPLLLSPTGIHAVHPQGEVAVAGAAAERSLLMGLSSFASCTVEDVVRANPRVLFQVYWSGTRADVEWRVERARAAGVVGLILTMDWCFPEARRDRAGGARSLMPRRPKSIEALRYSGEIALRPSWLYAFARGGLPRFVVPNMATPDDPEPTFRDVTDRWKSTPPPTWDDVRWLRDLWGGPFMVKGIMRIDDARRAVDAGATAISVSNHGGMNLDGTPAPIRVLTSTAEAVGDEVEVVMDGGVRRGADIAKAIALGARAVMVGRAYLFALAAAGQPGVVRMIDIMRSGLSSTLCGLGLDDVRKLGASSIAVPNGFTRSLGT
jgi:heme/flavin dehydrogenase (mycofactocin system)